MAELVLIKHALPVQDFSVPAHTWHLSEQGRADSEALGAWLARRLERQPVWLAASREPKAIQTAEIVSRHLGQMVRVIPGLHEHARPRSAQMSPEAFQMAVKQLFERPAEVVFGDESANQARERFTHAMDTLLQDAGPAQNGVVVAHGTVISLYAARLAGWDGFDLWKKLGLPAAVILELPLRSGLVPVIYQDWNA